MLQPYPETVEQSMKRVFAQLSEKDRRQYAAVETQKLPHGGQRYIVNLLGCSPKTIRRGQGDLADPERLPETGRIRHPGGGRKPILGHRFIPPIGG